MRKIFEIKNTDWEKGLSYETENMVGGIFKTFKNCDPFVRNGSFSPTRVPTRIGSGTIGTTNTIKYILPYYNAESRFYVFCDNYKLYDVEPDSPTVTDVSAQITSGSATSYTLAIFKGRLIYIAGTSARSNIIPVSSGSDVAILTGLSGSYFPFCIGADRNGYIGNGNNVAKITNTTGTSGNTTTVAASLESGFQVKKLLNDGRYLVWLASNQQGSRGSCVVAFWDMAKSVFDQIFEFQDSDISAAEIIGDTIKIITPRGIYLCSSAMRPRLVVPFSDVSGGVVTTSDAPTLVSGATLYRNNFLLWTSPSDRLLAHGTNIVGRTERLFNPNTITGTLNTIGTDDTHILVGATVGGDVHLYQINSNGAANTAVANVAGFTLPQPYTFSHARIVMRQPISSGVTVALKLLNAASTKTIKASETRTNTTDPDEQNLIFDHTSAGDGSDVGIFSEVSDIEITTNGAVKSIEIYGEPTDERASYA